MKKTILTLFTLSICLLLPSIAESKCYILGDSIAQGVSKYKGECNSSTKVGLNTNDAKTYFTSKGKLYFDKVIISLGINDKGQPERTWGNLFAIRSNLQANNVIWILPNMNYRQQNYLVKELASRFGDSFIDVTKVVGKDGIHPTPAGYKIIAESISLEN